MRATHPVWPTRIVSVMIINLTACRAKSQPMFNLNAQCAIVHVTKPGGINVKRTLNDRQFLRITT